MYGIVGRRRIWGEGNFCCMYVNCSEAFLFCSGKHGVDYEQASMYIVWGNVSIKGAVPVL